MNPKDRIGRQKPSLSFCPTRPILDMADAARHGAGKYGPFNWRTERVSTCVYLNAVFRHLCRLLEGEDDDKDSGLPHEAHIMAGMAILLDARQTGNVDDDRLDRQAVDESVT